MSHESDDSMKSAHFCKTFLYKHQTPVFQTRCSYSACVRLSTYTASNQVPPLLRTYLALTDTKKKHSRQTRNDLECVPNAFASVCHSARAVSVFFKQTLLLVPNAFRGDTPTPGPRKGGAEARRKAFRVRLSVAMLSASAYTYG